MKSTLLSAFLALCMLPALATSDPVSAYDPLEVTFYNPKQTFDLHLQQVLREQPAWQAFAMQHENWHVQFNETNGLPQRAYGKAIPTFGNTGEERAWNFVNQSLAGFSLPLDEIELQSTAPVKDLLYLHYDQVHAGHKVLNGGMIVKLWQDQVIMWGADVYSNITTPAEPTLDAFTAQVIAEADMVNTIVSTDVVPELGWIALPVAMENDVHLVYQVLVNTQNENGVPANYYTLVDAHSGTILYRQNRVQHFASCPTCKRPENKDGREVRTMGMMAVDGSISAEVYTINPFETTEVQGLPHLEFTLGGSNVVTDADGLFTSSVTGPATAQIPLSGTWCEILTNGVTPSFSTNLTDGNNLVSYDGEATIRELSAYRSTNLIHDHLKATMPSFTQMDFSLPTNIDVSGECNAFYDGSSINFYNIGGGCNATSLIADVVYHEYGHGINGTYYINEGQFFTNGAMNEGYADFWAISLSDNPHVGQGFYTDNTDGIRRYDQDPKVYPVDIVAEVHADGEIICGAWWDTHLLMGADWDLTLDLWVQAFAGLQATAMNGNEGVAFSNVLLDVLQADDDDGDITNGTPNGYAIVEGFDIHGITLVSSAEVSHADELTVPADEAITIPVEIDINFPFTEYLDQGSLFYQINEGAVQEVELNNTSGDNYEAIIPGQPQGTLVAYYIGLRDINEVYSNFLPAGAAQADANLPFYLIVGLEKVETHDNDITEDWGPWQTGVAGDLATTGQWEVNIPIGSLSSAGELVAPSFQHTPGADGELCFLTGQSANINDGMGANDVDGGHTTLRSPVMDLSERTNPILSYWRWYVNGPAGGANPGTDWWQVYVSDDGGDSWTVLEETRTQDNSWRRKAFRVADYVEVNDQFRIQMIASDSTFVGQNLDGGSLIEAAVDDIFLWDEVEISVEENAALDGQWQLYPNPATENVTLALEFTGAAETKVEITNALGQIVYRDAFNQALGQRSLPVATLRSGMYQVRVMRNGSVSVKPLSVLHP